MAKISYSKLGLKIENNCNTFEWGEGLVIEVKRYLPIEEKVDLINLIVNAALEDNMPFGNSIKINNYFVIEVTKAYTNISFTDKQLSDGKKLYDSLVSSGLWTQIVANIPSEEYRSIKEILYKQLDNIYKYKNSAFGIIEAFSKDYAGLNKTIDELKEQIGNAPEELNFLQEVLTKMG